MGCVNVHRKVPLTTHILATFQIFWQLLLAFEKNLSLSIILLTIFFFFFFKLGPKREILKNTVLGNISHRINIFPLLLEAF